MGFKDGFWVADILRNNLNHEIPVQFGASKAESSEALLEAGSASGSTEVVPSETAIG